MPRVAPCVDEERVTELRTLGLGWVAIAEIIEFPVQVVKLRLRNEQRPA